MNLQIQGNASLPKGKLDKHHKEGVLFVTYSLLVSNSKAMKDDVVSTAAEAKQLDSSIPEGSRLEQIVDWLNGAEDDPLVVLDECHKAKNLIAIGGKFCKSFILPNAVYTANPYVTTCYSAQFNVTYWSLYKWNILSLQQDLCSN